MIEPLVYNCTAALNMKNKANFLCMNSGIILTKLLNVETERKTVRRLQMILLCDTNIDSLFAECNDLTYKGTLTSDYEDGPETAINVLLYLENKLGDYGYSDEGMNRLAQKLREYVQYFEPVKDKQFVKKEENFT